MIQLGLTFIKAFSPNEQLIMLQLLLHADSNGVVEFSDRGISKITEIPYQQVRTIHQKWLAEKIIFNNFSNAPTNAKSTFVTINDYVSYTLFNIFSNASTNAKNANFKEQETKKGKDKETPLTTPIETEKENKKEKEVEKRTSSEVPKEAVDYKAIVECWNQYNGSRLGRVDKLTERRKANIKRQLDNHGITPEELMAFFRSLPYADRWLYTPGGEHRNWKPDFDWWMVNTNQWLTKGLEGKVHKENPQAYQTANTRQEEIVYTPLTDGNIVWLEREKCYKHIGMIYDDMVFDGYTSENRPNGARLKLSNAGGFITWDSQQKKWLRDEQVS